MDFIDHLRRCNRWDPAGFRPFRVGGQVIGHVRHAFAAHLVSFADVFRVAEDSVDLIAAAGDRTAAMQRVVLSLGAAGILPKLHGEEYAIVRQWGGETLFRLDRRMVPAFGLRAFGIHVNGFVRDGDRLKLWIGRRADDKTVEPGKLDNMVAGGLPAGITPAENVIKEAAEEAGLPRAVAERARSVGAITYCQEDAIGLKPDTLFVYDLELPSETVPRNVDGEIAEFMLMDADAVAERMRSGLDFKFNVTLVLIDFLIRHGRLTPENQPDYLALVAGLRMPLP